MYIDERVISVILITLLISMFLSLSDNPKSLILKSPLIGTIFLRKLGTSFFTWS